MRRDYLVWSLLAVLLLLVGLVIGRWAVDVSPGAVSLDPPQDDGFRTWFWERRTLDLITQVGLIFAGALGVAAILPGQGEPTGLGAADRRDEPAADEMVERGPA